MIQPRDAEQVKYVHILAAFLIRAQAQVDGGDKLGSVQFTDAFRSMKQWGENRYPQENGGLVEWAEMLAREDPRNDRLAAFLTEQDARLAKPAPEPLPDAEITWGTGDVFVDLGVEKPNRLDAKDLGVPLSPVWQPEPWKPEETPTVPTTLANVVERPKPARKSRAKKETS